MRQKNCIISAFVIIFMLFSLSIFGNEADYFSGIPDIKVTVSGSDTDRYELSSADKAVKKVLISYDKKNNKYFLGDSRATELTMYETGCYRLFKNADNSVIIKTVKPEYKMTVARMTDDKYDYFECRQDKLKIELYYGYLSSDNDLD